MLHHDQDAAAAYPAPQTTRSDGLGRKAESSDDRVKRTHDDQHDREGAMRAVCVCVCVVYIVLFPVV